MGIKTIDEFAGENWFLSNFYNKCENGIVYNGIKYNHTEGAFQAQKTLDEKQKAFIATLSASESKKACGRYGLNGFKIQLRPDWEEVKDQIMYEVVKAKFEQNPELKEKLLATGDAELIEGTTWHDNYWGNCTCPRCSNVTGRNQLGKTLMKVREELRG